jgi:hypothetical protein
LNGTQGFEPLLTFRRKPAGCRGIALLHARAQKTDYTRSVDSDRSWVKRQAGSSLGESWGAGLYPCHP